MTASAPNPSTRWGRILVEELVAAGVSAACVAPGSRSTPLTLAFVEAEDATVHSHLDERSAAFFALGRSKRSGEPTALICTSGTAAANFHPAVIEADRSRTPLVVCTADRPPELHDSGANQTVEQAGLYGGAVRWERTLPEPGTTPRKLRALRVAANRAVATSTRPPAGPVHLNVPLAKPLAPTRETDDEVGDSGRSAPLGSDGRAGPYVSVAAGRPTLDDDAVATLAAALRAADRGLLVAGPADPGDATDPAAVAALAEATGFPVLADPLSGLRFGPHVESAAVCGGYDAYLDPAVTATWPDPDLVLRFGASPTSASLRRYLARTECRQVVVDPAGGWREATFTASDLVAADPGWLARALADRVPAAGAPAWTDRFRRAESAHWAALDGTSAFFEGGVLAAAVAAAPEPATVFVSNSMPVRDVDRFGRPSAKRLAVLGNRGASGIDGITSTALGAGSATDDPLVVLTGDLAFYHDMNGLLATSRCGVDATVVVVDNDGGGIFHRLPIAEHEALEDWFVTPHGLDLSATAPLYDLGFERVRTPAAFETAYREALNTTGTSVVAIDSDAVASHAVRDRLADTVRDELTD